MSFTFKFHGLRYALPGNTVDDRFPGPVTIVLGFLTEGTLHPGDSLHLQLNDGTTFHSKIFMLYDNLHEWLGMPFYHTVDAKSFTGEFALVLHDQPPERNITCPGIAISLCSSTDA